MASVVYETGLCDASGVEAGLTKEIRQSHGRGRTAHNLSSSSLRKKSDNSLVSKVRCRVLRNLLTNLQEVLLGTKLFVLFLAVPLAFVAQNWRFGRTWVFALSLLGLIPLAERLSFLTEQISFYTGPTVGSILSNLLLVLGTSFFCGGLVNLSKEQRFDRKQADANTALLLLGALCHMLPLMLRYTVNSDEGSFTAPTLAFSRATSIVMLAAYVAYLFFQLKTHGHLFKPQEENDTDDTVSDAESVIGFTTAIAWLVGMTILIAVLSQYAVCTIEAASESWGLSTSFISVILLPIIGNAAEHAGAIIFALKNKLDITLGVTLGSATQISMFVVPLSVIMAWIMGMQMDLDFKLLETGSLVGSILITLFSLRDGTSHYLKGFVLVLAYLVIGACFFVLRTPSDHANGVNLNAIPTISSIMVA
ncbi:vacuolar cation/proton exchanger 1a isoform X2 [Dendrobium catenatum]|uniref:vacuolar cation/proton exchanger 1a isoform X2 n=1 Tax=Dendrobium catenatum TaxID=906689 RepID=UPI0010A07C6D|nr:vacuolar cation/proton exchanger 1a isoform X2 [Dendrobium catenatum]